MFGLKPYERRAYAQLSVWVCVHSIGTYTISIQVAIDFVSVCRCEFVSLWHKNSSPAQLIKASEERHAVHLLSWPDQRVYELTQSILSYPFCYALRPSTFSYLFHSYRKREELSHSFSLSRSQLFLCDVRFSSLVRKLFPSFIQHVLRFSLSSRCRCGTKCQNFVCLFSGTKKLRDTLHIILSTLSAILT